MDEINICGLCKKEYKGYGNNPTPLICKGRACDDCNTTKVIRQRIINNGKYTADEVDDIIEDIQTNYISDSALATLSRKCGG